MKILLLGKTGQVGSELCRSLVPVGELTALGRADLNLENFNALKKILHAKKPNVIVNAAAYTAVDRAEQSIETAYLMNATLVQVLADYASMHQSLLIHYSTDYVFDGLKNNAYVESDTCNPLNVYGQSKRAGEEAIIKSGAPFLLFRTSWVFSRTGRNFVNTILKLALEREKLKIVSDQYGAPTSAKLIADVTTLAIAAHYQKKIESGIYHLTASGFTTWHQLACFVVKCALKNQIPLKLHPVNIMPIPSEEYPVPAKRPHNSRLDTSELSRSLHLTLPDWRIDVENLLNTYDYA